MNPKNTAPNSRPRTKNKSLLGLHLFAVSVSVIVCRERRSVAWNEMLPMNNTIDFRLFFKEEANGRQY
jgi:hypothetical protein